jgi:uncharacterized protein (DUF2235 family)
VRIEKEYRKDFSAKPGERNVLIFMDGTWNDENGKQGSGLITNVVKLYKSLQEDSPQQISRYFRGIGNDDDYNFWGNYICGGTGKDEKRIRDEAYAMIAREYRTGDRIHIFGFSRGAASARMLANQVYKEGIPENIKVVWETSANRTTRNIEDRFVRYISSGKKLDVDIEFLGVWDTIGAFGIPINILGIPLQRWNLFKDMHVARNVKKAVHCVCMDETRDAYVPTLMNYKAGVVEEVWFPGVHSDIGGSYKEDALGKISLGFMVDRLKKHSSKYKIGIKFKKEDLEKYTTVGEEEEYVFHFFGLGWKKSIREIYVIKDNKKGNNIPPKIHSSIVKLQRSRKTTSLYRFRKTTKTIRIQYNPPNAKIIRGKYEIVE